MEERTSWLLGRTGLEKWDLKWKLHLRRGHKGSPSHRHGDISSTTLWVPAQVYSTQKRQLNKMEKWLLTIPNPTPCIWMCKKKTWKKKEITCSFHLFLPSEAPLKLHSSDCWQTNSSPRCYKSKHMLQRFFHFNQKSFTSKYGQKHRKWLNIRVKISIHTSVSPALCTNMKK